MDTCSQYLTPNPLPVGGVLKICSFRYLNSLNKRHIIFDVAEVYKDQCFSHSGMIFGKMDTCSQYLNPNPLPVGGVLKISQFTDLHCIKKSCKLESGYIVYICQCSHHSGGGLQKNGYLQPNFNPNPPTGRGFYKDLRYAVPMTSMVPVSMSEFLSSQYCNPKQNYHNWLH